MYICDCTLALSKTETIKLGNYVYFRLIFKHQMIKMEQRKNRETISHPQPQSLYYYELPILSTSNSHIFSCVWHRIDTAVKICEIPFKDLYFLKMYKMIFNFAYELSYLVPFIVSVHESFPM